MKNAFISDAALGYKADLTANERHSIATRVAHVAG
jgi:hypothetical protein